MNKQDLLMRVLEGMRDEMCDSAADESRYLDDYVEKWYGELNSLIEAMAEEDE